MHSKNYELIYLIIAYYSLYLSISSKRSNNFVYFAEILISMAYPKYYISYKLFIKMFKF